MKNYSFILCSRHYKKVLARTMSSALPQSILGDEFVLVINQKDASGYPEDFLKLFHKIIFSQTVGCGAARCTGVIAASHELIAFIDDDTLLLEHWRKESLFFLENPSVAFYQARRPAKETMIDREGHKPYLYFFDTAGSVFRKSLVMSVGNFDGDLKRCEDTDMATKIFYAGWDSSIGSISVMDFEPESILYLVKRFFYSLKPNALLHLRAGLRLKHPSLFHLPNVVRKMGYSFLKRNAYEVLLTFIPVYIYQRKLNIIGYPIQKRQKKALLQFDGVVYILRGATRIIFCDEGIKIIHIGEASDILVNRQDFTIEFNLNFISIKIVSTDISYKKKIFESELFTPL